MAAWGGVNWLRQHGWKPAVVTGPATDNQAGSSRIEELCGVPALNARTRTEELANHVFDRMGTGATGLEDSKQPKPAEVAS